MQRNLTLAGRWGQSESLWGEASSQAKVPVLGTEPGGCRGRGAGVLASPCPPEATGSLESCLRPGPILTHPPPGREVGRTMGVGAPKGALAPAPAEPNPLKIPKGSIGLKLTSEKSASFMFYIFFHHFFLFFKS